MDLRYVTLADDPSLEPLLWGPFSESWPRFMLEDPVAELLMGDLPAAWPSLQGLLLADDGTAVAKSHATGFVWSGDLADLPARGWDAMLERGVADGQARRPPTAVSALEANVRSGFRGAGLSRLLIERMRDAARDLGVGDLFAPGRPTRKAHVPREPMAMYVARTDAEGLPEDPWMRVHARLGAVTVRVCPCSMTIMGTLDGWRHWTGLPFDTDGRVEVPGALVPVHVDTAQDHAVYVEPNVWMHHRLD